MNRFNFFYLIISILVFGFNCSNNLSGGFGSETSNGIVSTSWHSDSVNLDLSNMVIELIPSNFNNMLDSDSLIQKMYTDDSGKANFTSVPFGVYNIVATAEKKNKKAIYLNLNVSKDSTYNIVDTLSEVGSTKLYFSKQPANIDFACYLPGINIAVDFLSSELDSSGEYVLVIDSLPAMKETSIYGYQISANEKFLIDDKVSVESGVSKDLFVDLVWSAYKNSNDSTPINEITSVVNDSLGNTWFSQTGMIIKIDTGGVADFYKSNDIGMSLFPIRNSILDSVGNPLFSTSNGILKYDGLNWSMWDVFSGNFILQNILLKTYNRLSEEYCFTSNTGIRFLKNDSIKIIDKAITTDNDTISLLTITSMSATNNGLLWIGSRWNGVYLYDGNDWIKFSENLPSKEVNDIVTYDDGRVIISTRSGILYYDGITWNEFNSSNSPLNNSIRSSFAKNNLWVISENNLFRFDGSQWHNFNEVNSMVKSSKVTYLTIDETRNRGYLGTKEGILVFDYR